MTEAHHDLERLLRSARPAPRDDFVAELEDSLLPAARRRAARPRLRFALAGTAFAAVLAAVVVGMGVAGLLPFSSSSGEGARAKPTCERVVVERMTRLPQFRDDGHGHISVRYKRALRPHVVTRCR